jgi:hypothetical protein
MNLSIKVDILANLRAKIKKSKKKNHLMNRLLLNQTKIESCVCPSFKGPGKCQPNFINTLPIKKQKQVE